MQSLIRFRQRIFYRQAQNTVLVAFLLGTILSAIQIGYDLWKERQKVDRTVAAMTGMLRESAIQAVYEIHRPLAERVVNGLLEFAPICKAQIVDEFGTVLAERERGETHGRFQWLVTLIFEEEKQYTMPLVYAPKHRLVGYIHLSVDSYLIAADFFRRSALIVVSDLLRNFFLSSILLLIFYLSLTRPLLDMVTRLSSVDIGSPDERLLAPFCGHEHDELGLLVHTINRLLERLGESLAEHRTIQKELETHRDHLEQVVKQRTAELRHLVEVLKVEKSRAEAANETKSLFLASMSHELRTPLNAILGFAQLMSRDKSLSQEHLNNIDIITRSGEHLLALINDILDLSKIEAGQVTMQENNFDFHHLLHDMEDMFMLRAKEKQLRLLFDVAPNVPQYIRADEGRLRQVCMNLLSNAVKFTHEGGVVVRVTSEELPKTSEKFAFRTPHSTIRLKFDVEDSGPGIAPEEMALLFQAFVQTEAGRASSQGTGLGLVISREFVQLMGGTLTAGSEVGQGSVFSFDIVAGVLEGDYGRDTPSVRRVVALEPNQPRYRILIVDDKETNRLLLAKQLTSLSIPDGTEHGFDIREAANGREALYIWETWDPHLILMDMQMPVMDGYEATQRMKATAKGQATTIIALTASTFEQERRAIFSTGCDDFIRKPFREEDIFEIMVKHLGLRFVYEELDENTSQNSAHSTGKKLSSKALQGLPPMLLEELEDTIIRAERNAITACLGVIRTHDPAIADQLEHLIMDFEYQKILLLIQEAGESS